MIGFNSHHLMSLSQHSWLGLSCLHATYCVLSAECCERDKRWDDCWIQSLTAALSICPTLRIEAAEVATHLTESSSNLSTISSIQQLWLADARTGRLSQNLATRCTAGNVARTHPFVRQWLRIVIASTQKTYHGDESIQKTAFDISIRTYSKTARWALSS